MESAKRHKTDSDVGREGSRKKEVTAGQTLRYWDLSVCPKWLVIKIQVKVE